MSIINTAYWLNTGWMLSCAREAFAFHRSVGEVRRTQERILKRTLRNNRDTWYGRRYGFASIQSTTDFQRRVPRVGYDELRDTIDRIASGESAVLTRDPVTVLEPTGGSSQAEKLIPYNAALQKQFQRAIAAWVYDLMHGLPAVRKGRAYWSISPLAQPTRFTNGGIPVGFDDDRDYLSGWQRAAVSRLLVMPAAVRHLRSIENARYLTALHLLASETLSLMSVWSPTWLTALLADVPNWADAIAEDLRRGHVRLPHPQRETRTPAMPIVADTRRAEQLKRIFAEANSTAEWAAQCWPGLALVSCWGDASSALYLGQLRNQLSHALIQPKGLLATEGVVSIPLLSKQSSGSVLAIRSHFLEFADADATSDSNGPVFLADELQLGRRYRVLLTNGGGLYRYDLGDEIEVVGFHKDCPSVRLLGRSGQVCDLVGEKLCEPFVRSIFDQVFNRFGVQVRFALMAPIAKPTPKYRLYLQAESAGPIPIDRLMADMEHHLRRNPHYRLAIDAKQLQSIDVQLLDHGAWEVYEHVCLRRGQKLGDIKPVALDPWEGWDDAFKTDRQPAVR